MGNQSQYSGGAFRGLIHSAEAGIPTTSDLSGTVETQGGDPVENATVKAYGVDFANLNGTIEEKRQEANEITTDLSSVAPDSWYGLEGVAGSEGQSQKSPQSLLEGSTSGKYAMAHSPSDWDIPDPTVVTAPIIGDTGFRLSDPQLGFGTNEDSPYGGLRHAPAGETIILSVWDGSNTAPNFLENSADEDLPGATTDGTIVVEQLGPGGGDNTVNTETFNTTDSIGGSFTSKEHKFASWSNPSPGFYRIYPESNPAASYIIAVGKPEQILSGWQQGLENKRGNLLDQVDYLTQLRNDGVVKTATTTTNENGSFEMSFSSSTVKTVDVVAYKVPSALNIDPKNATRADAREYYENVEIPKNASDTSDIFDIESMYVQTGRENYDVPSQNVSVEVREVSAESFVSINKTQGITDAITDYFNRVDFTSLAGLPQSVIEDMSREELESLYDTLAGQIANHPELEQRVADRLGIEQSEVVTDAEGLSTQELLERIRAIDVVLKQGPQISEPPTTNPGEVTDEVMGAVFEFAQIIPSDRVTVLAKYSNGTTVPVNESYITVEETGLFGGTGTRITVSDYPVPSNDTAGVEFVTRVTTENGESGEGRQIIRNPNFTGSVPGLEHISFSTLAPGPDESVSLEVAPNKRSNFGQLEDVQVVGPNGAINTTIDGGEASFRTNGEGRYSAEVTYSNADGNNVTETVDFRALPGNIDNPATVRAQHGFAGPYALTGDDLVGGAVETRLGNGQVNVLARVGGNDDPPPTLHSHVETIDMPPRGTVCSRIVREPDDTNVRQRATVITHMQQLGDDSYVYRVAGGEIQPITSDGSRYGSVTTGENSTTISTYTEADGGACVRYISNPSLGDDIQWQIQQLQERLPDIPGLDILQMTPTTPFAATGAIA